MQGQLKCKWCAREDVPPPSQVAPAAIYGVRTRTRGTTRYQETSREHGHGREAHTHTHRYRHRRTHTGMGTRAHARARVCVCVCVCVFQGHRGCAPKRGRKATCYQAKQKNCERITRADHLCARQSACVCLLLVS